MKVARIHYLGSDFSSSTCLRPNVTSPAVTIELTLSVDDGDNEDDEDEDHHLDDDDDDDGAGITEYPSMLHQAVFALPIMD